MNTEPGLYFKLPDPIQKTTVFDRRLLDYDSNPDPDLHQGQEDPHHRQLRPVADRRRPDLHAGPADRRGGPGPSRRHHLLGAAQGAGAARTFRGGGHQPRGDHGLRDGARANQAAQVYGIEVLDVRIKRADLPPENEQAVYDRMRAERAREAKAYRSEGEEEALKIRAETDLEAATIAAVAYEQAQGIRGQGRRRGPGDLRRGVPSTPPASTSSRGPSRPTRRRCRRTRSSSSPRTPTSSDTSREGEVPRRGAGALCGPPALPAEALRCWWRSPATWAPARRPWRRMLEDLRGPPDRRGPPGPAGRRRERRTSAAAWPMPSDRICSTDEGEARPPGPGPARPCRRGGAAAAGGAREAGAGAAHLAGPARRSRTGGGIVLLDAPLVFEWGLQDRFDAVIVLVTTEPGIATRNGWPGTGD